MTTKFLLGKSTLSLSKIVINLFGNAWTLHLGLFLPVLCIFV
jgi:hypothetical protein